MGITGVVAMVGVIGVFGLAAIGFAALAWLPAIEIHETHLLIGPRVFRTGVLGTVPIGRRVIPWREIRRVDRPRWQARWGGQTRWRTRWSLVAVNLTLEDGTRVTVVYAGRSDSGRSLLRHLRRCAQGALLDGIPHRQFWGHTKSEYLPAEFDQAEGINLGPAHSKPSDSERTPVRRLGETEPRGLPPAAISNKHRLLLAEDEAEIEDMFQQLKSVGRLDRRQDTRRDDSRRDDSRRDDSRRDTRGDAPREPGEGFE